VQSNQMKAYDLLLREEIVNTFNAMVICSNQFMMLADLKNKWLILIGNCLNRK